MKVLESFRNNHPDFGNSITPHSPYSVSKTLFHLLNQNTADQLISIHNQETPAENELYGKKTGEFLGLFKDLGIDIDSFLPTGKTSFASWIDYFNNDQKIISVHNSFTTADDLLAIKPGKQVHFCVCINANLYIENTLPPVDMLIQNDCRILMGTDSYASNSRLNMMEEIKSMQKYFPHISLETILQWATFNGAQALGISDRFGSFEKGKSPGLVLIEEGKAIRID
jgi:cytosine/adenosine deaminase-related metal-dependent hydrolase